MASRNLGDLDPVFRVKAQQVLAACADRGVTLLVTCTLRSMTEQTALYAQGRTAPGRKVTNAQAGQSAHNYGLAMDVVPLRNGKPVWDARAPEWQVYGEEVRKAGLEWAGDWRRFKEYPHCQMPDWRMYIAAKAV
jgi:peptidoglycan L-alanyl-D-glutamate endopeptidase CwlK